MFRYRYTKSDFSLKNVIFYNSNLVFSLHYNSIPRVLFQFIDIDSTLNKSIENLTAFDKSADVNYLANEFLDFVQIEKLEGVKEEGDILTFISRERAKLLFVLFVRASYLHENLDIMAFDFNDRTVSYG